MERYGGCVTSEIFAADTKEFWRTEVEHLTELKKVYELISVSRSNSVSEAFC
jgi:hypothetical protein